jgi:type I restriction enzyme, S subunit
LSAPSYSAYVDTGIPWLGMAPQAWTLQRIKDSVAHTKNGVWGDEPLHNVDDIWCVRVADFDRRRLSVSSNDPTFRNVQQTERRGRILQRGDLLLEKSGGGETSPVGFVVLFDEDESAVCSNFVAGVRLKADQDSKFWLYFHSFMYLSRVNQRSIKQTSGIQNLDQASYFDEVVAAPPVDEQRSIAEYLDRETGKIDELIAKQEQLVICIAKRKSAAIDATVTTGLNRPTRRKPAGLPWVEELPHDWKVVPFTRITKGRVDYRGATPTKTDAGVQLITARNIKPGKIDYETSEEFVAADEYEQIMRRGRPQIGDVLLTMEAPLGNIALVDRVDVAFAQRLVKFRLDESIADARFVCFAMNSLYFQHELQSRGTGSTAIGLKASKLVDLRFLLPPLSEQRSIAEYLENQTTKFDVLANSTNKAIELLLERRAALIAAAVTGKIDVRGL